MLCSLQYLQKLLSELKNPSLESKQPSWQALNGRKKDSWDEWKYPKDTGRIKEKSPII